VHGRGRAAHGVVLALEARGQSVRPLT
jgi:hypothetical protein